MDKGVVEDEEDHGVLADEVDDGDASLGQREEQAREADEGADGVNASSPGTLHPFVEAHVVFAVVHAVADEEEKDE